MNFIHIFVKLFQLMKQIKYLHHAKFVHIEGMHHFDYGFRFQVSQKIQAVRIASAVG